MASASREWYSAYRPTRRVRIDQQTKHRAIGLVAHVQAELEQPIAGAILERLDQEEPD
jgi:hypothetical protein